MRIGIITDFFPMYGAKTIAKLASCLEKMGHSVVILTSKASQTGKYYESGIRKYLSNSVIIRLNSMYLTPSGSPIALPLSLPLIANEYFNDYSVDLVHIHFLASYSFQLYALLASIRKKYPIVATPHGVVEGYSSPLLKLMAYSVRSTSKIGLKSISAFTVVSRSSIPFLQRLGVPSKRIYYVPNGVDTSVFHPMNKSDAERSLGLPQTKNLRILFLAHLRESKGVDIFIDAAERIKAKYKDVEFLIIGSGPLENHVSKRCRISTGCISHMSYLDESLLPAAFNSADVYVLPSYVEGLPQSLLESMSCGTPSIATDVGGVSELFPAETEFAILQPGSVDEVVDRVTLLIENRHLRERLGLKQREHIQSNYSLSKTIVKQLAIYKEVLKHER